MDLYNKVETFFAYLFFWLIIGMFSCTILIYATFMPIARLFDNKKINKPSSTNYN